MANATYQAHKNLLGKILPLPEKLTTADIAERLGRVYTELSGSLQGADFPGQDEVWGQMKAFANLIVELKNRAA
jgi:hypothetical protein